MPVQIVSTMTGTKWHVLGEHGQTACHRDAHSNDGLPIVINPTPADSAPDLCERCAYTLPYDNEWRKAQRTFHQTRIKKLMKMGYIPTPTDSEYLIDEEPEL